MFRIIYLTLDYIIGYWLKIRSRVVNSPTVFIFDRYAYDMALDPRRFRLDLPIKVIHWFTRLAPKPDLVLCLHGRPEVIAARKQELPLEETRRQLMALLAFAESEPRAVLISTDTSIKETRDQVLKVLSELLYSRCGSAPR